MAEDEKKIADMTSEERAIEWVAWVKSQVNSTLDFYLEKALSSNINVKYIPHTIEVLESGPVYSDNTIDGVVLSLEINFEKPMLVE